MIDNILGGGGGFASGGDSGAFNSKSANLNLNETVNTSIAASEGGIAIEGGGDIVITDRGAVQSAVNLIANALASFTQINDNTVTNAFEFSSGVASDSIDFAGETFSTTLGLLEDGLSTFTDASERARQGNQALAEQSLTLAESVKTGFSSSLTRFLIVGVIVVSVVVMTRK